MRSLFENPLYGIDFYKADHRRQYPEGTEQVFSNWTPRKSRIAGIDEVVLFGLQYYAIEYLQNRWMEYFFQQSKDYVLLNYSRTMEAAGLPLPDYQHIADLHDLGYMPIEIWGLPEGTASPIGCPQFVMWNTQPDFFWLTNYLETQVSNVIWKGCTTATLAKAYRKIFERGMRQAGADLAKVDIMGHDFSYRGMTGTEDAALGGAGHLLSFNGTDSLPAIKLLEEYYQALPGTVGGSIPATEHSVMCMGTKDDEYGTFKRLITEVYPSGPVSIVSDTWDYWKVLQDTVPRLHKQIEERDGIVVFRPDSGDPADIICGTNRERSVKFSDRIEGIGTFEWLAMEFGGEPTAEGYTQLNPCVGAIYGDSITLDRARDITDRLLAKGFVPDLVYGIGSYTYQMQTRDTFGFAMKATAGVVNGEVREIFKDPATDDGTKKSLKGYVAVDRHDAGIDSWKTTYSFRDRVTLEDTKNCAFEPVFRDGSVMQTYTLENIRARMRRE